MMEMFRSANWALLFLNNALENAFSVKVVATLKFDSWILDPTYCATFFELFPEITSLSPSFVHLLVLYFWVSVLI